jgi:transposase
MAYGRAIHPNAPLTQEGRRRVVASVLGDGWSVTATAEWFHVDANTVRKWRDRYSGDGVDGLVDRSSRPHTLPNRTRRQVRAKVCRIRKKRRWGADHIAYEVGFGDVYGAEHRHPGGIGSSRSG